jgi:predicted hotdog family 3-hydroxylacyl-ACP dehydratase
LHGGLLAERAGAPANSGLLAGLRQVKLYRARLDDSEAPLTIRAHRLLADPHNLLYAFAMDLNREPVAEGRIAIITQ